MSEESLLDQGSSLASSIAAKLGENPELAQRLGDLIFTTMNGGVGPRNYGALSDLPHGSYASDVAAERGTVGALRNRAQAAMVGDVITNVYNNQVNKIDSPWARDLLNSQLGTKLLGNAALANAGGGANLQDSVQLAYAAAQTNYVRYNPNEANLSRFDSATRGIGHADLVMRDIFDTAAKTGTGGNLGLAHVGGFQLDEVAQVMSRMYESGQFSENKVRGAVTKDLVLTQPKYQDMLEYASKDDKAAGRATTISMAKATSALHKDLADTENTKYDDLRDTYSKQVQRKGGSAVEQRMQTLGVMRDVFGNLSATEMEGIHGQLTGDTVTDEGSQRKVKAYMERIASMGKILKLTGEELRDGIMTANQISTQLDQVRGGINITNRDGSIVSFTGSRYGATGTIAEAGMRGSVNGEMMGIGSGRGKALAEIMAARATDSSLAGLVQMSQIMSQVEGTGISKEDAQQIAKLGSSPSGMAQLAPYVDRVAAAAGMSRETLLGDAAARERAVTKFIATGNLAPDAGKDAMAQGSAVALESMRRDRPNLMAASYSETMQRNAMNFERYAGTSLGGNRNPSKENWAAAAKRLIEADDSIPEEARKEKLEKLKLAVSTATDSRSAEDLFIGMTDDGITTRTARMMARGDEVKAAVTGVRREDLGTFAMAKVLTGSLKDLATPVKDDEDRAKRSQLQHDLSKAMIARDVPKMKQLNEQLKGYLSDGGAKVVSMMASSNENNLARVRQQIIDQTPEATIKAGQIVGDPSKVLANVIRPEDLADQIQRDAVTRDINDQLRAAGTKNNVTGLLGVFTTGLKLPNTGTKTEQFERGLKAAYLSYFHDLDMTKLAAAKDPDAEIKAAMNKSNKAKDYEKWRADYVKGLGVSKDGKTIDEDALSSADLQKSLTDSDNNQKAANPWGGLVTSFLSSIGVGNKSTADAAVADTTATLIGGWSNVTDPTMTVGAKLRTGLKATEGTADSDLLPLAYLKSASPKDYAAAMAAAKGDRSAVVQKAIAPRKDDYERYAKVIKAELRADSVDAVLKTPVAQLDADVRKSGAAAPAPAAPKQDATPPWLIIPHAPTSDGTRVMKAASAATPPDVTYLDKLGGQSVHAAKKAADGTELAVSGSDKSPLVDAVMARLDPLLTRLASQIGVEVGRNTTIASSGSTRLMSNQFTATV